MKIDHSAVGQGTAIAGAEEPVEVKPFIKQAIVDGTRGWYLYDPSEKEPQLMPTALSIYAERGNRFILLPIEGGDKVYFNRRGNGREGYVYIQGRSLSEAEEQKHAKMDTTDKTNAEVANETFAYLNRCKRFGGRQQNTAVSRTDLPF